MPFSRQDRLLYRRLLGQVAPYRWAFAGSVLAMAIGGVVEGSFAWFLKTMLGSLFVERNDTYAALAAFGIVAVFFVSGLSHFAAGYGMQWVGNKLILNLRNLMFKKLLEVPVSYYHATTTGTLMSKVTHDVVGLQAAATTTLNALVRGSFTLATLLVTMFVLNWKLTLITFATVPLLGWVISIFGKRLREISRASQRANAGITDVLEETIASHRVIKIFGAQDYEATRFDAAANRIRRLNMKQSAAAAASNPFTHLIVSIAIAIIVYVAASRRFGAPMAVEDFVAFIVSAAALVPQIKGLTSVSEQIQRGLAAAESVFGLIDSPAETDHGTIVLPRARGEIVFQDVTLYYPDRPQPALEHLSLTIRPGETVALVGPSGGGKTSLINLIPRFFTPGTGGITLDGHDLQTIRLQSLREQIALVSQDVVLFNDSVAANIAYGQTKSVSQADLERVAQAAQALDFIRALPEGFATIIGENGARLSGGQRQRIAIARALLKDAPLLLLDEATSALDSESERAVQSALETLMKGRTSIVVAHRLSTIENADRIIVMAGGRIVESGTHSELLRAQGLYAGLHRMQFSTAA